MIPYLIWDEDNRVEIRSVEELEQLLDLLTVEAREDIPLSVELHVEEGISMYIVVGGEASPIAFYSATSRPPVIGGLGQYNNTDETIEYNHRGHYSVIRKQYAVPIVAAREAFRQFFQTRKRPNNIAWEY